jgi:phosphatidylglycerophosphatase A
MEPASKAPSPALFDRLWVGVGSIGPLGYCPASGTVTVAVVGVPLFWATHRLPLAMMLPILAVFIFVCVAIHQRGDRILGQKDSRILVWDEVAGFLVAVIGVPFTWQTALAAFLIERFLDIVKFWPARAVEDNGPGGWGVVGDDLVAGLYTLAIMHLLLYVAPNVWL